jgi:hypothetical protein
MKIVGKVTRDNLSFGDLGVGATFILSSEVGVNNPYVYMVLDDVTEEETGVAFNAVEIGGGSLACFENDRPIVRVKVEAHIVS